MSLGDYEVLTTRRCDVLVCYLENPLPVEDVNLEVYPSGRVVLYERGERGAVLDKVDASRRVNPATAEAIDRGRTLVVEIECEPRRRKA